MKDYVVFSLSELLTDGFEEKIKPVFSKFTCAREQDLEFFLQQKAIMYDKSKLGQTSLLVDKTLLDNGIFEIMAFYTVSTTSIDISQMSKSKKKKLLGNVPGRENLKSYSAFLIGQLGRSDKYNSMDLPGQVILNECLKTIYDTQRLIGGRLLILECREHMYDLFYKHHGFYKLSDELDQGLYTLFTKLDY